MTGRSFTWKHRESKVVKANVLGELVNKVTSERTSSHKKVVTRKQRNRNCQSTTGVLTQFLRERVVILHHVVPSLALLPPAHIHEASGCKFGTRCRNVTRTRKLRRIPQPTPGVSCKCLLPGSRTKYRVLYRSNVGAETSQEIAKSERIHSHMYRHNPIIIINSYILQIASPYLYNQINPHPNPSYSSPATPPNSTQAD